MSATVAVNIAYGGTPTYADVTSGTADWYFRSDDDPTNSDASAPILKHPDGVGNFYYSYWITLCLSISGSYTSIDNVKAYCDGTISWSLGTGGDVLVGVRDSGDNGCPLSTDYDQATGTAGTTGHYMDDGTNGHAYYKDQTATPVSITDYTSGSELTVDTVEHTGTEKTKAIVLQAKVDGDATAGSDPGSSTYEEITFSYEEVP